MCAYLHAGRLDDWLLVAQHVSKKQGGERTVGDLSGDLPTGRSSSGTAGGPLQGRRWVARQEEEGRHATDVSGKNKTNQ
jgi:hypothetical protein